MSQSRPRLALGAAALVLSALAPPALAADLSSTAPRRLSAAPPADLACASEYWLSFALPAVCSLFSFAVAAR